MVRISQIGCRWGDSVSRTRSPPHRLQASGRIAILPIDALGTGFAFFELTQATGICELEWQPVFLVSLTAKDEF